MKNYQLTGFYANHETQAIAEKVFTGKEHQSVYLKDQPNVGELLKDRDYTMVVVELNSEFKQQIRDLLEFIEESEFIIPVIIEKEDASVFEYSRNPGFHKNTISFPFNEREFALTLDLAIVRHEKKILKKKSHLFSEAVNQSANSIIITNPEGVIEFVNPSFEEITGYTFNEVLGKHTRIFKSGEQADEVYEKMWKIITMGVKWEGELLNRKKNGDLFWEETTISPIMDENGTILHYLAIKNDITERKKANEAIDNSKKLLREIIDRVPQFIFVRDSESRYQLVNKAFADYMGMHPKEIKGRTELELNPNKVVLEQILSEDRMVINQGKEIHSETSVYDTLQKRERYFQFSKVPFLLPKTGQTAVLSVWTCVTDQKLVENELRSAREKLLDAQKLAAFGNWSVDMATQTAQWSEQVYLQYGLDPAMPAPFGNDFYKHIHPDDREEVLIAIEKAKKTGFAKYECRAVKPSGEVTHIEATVKPVTHNDEVTGFFGTSLDITTRKTYEEEIIAARKEAIAASKTKSDFLSVMSHEIRTPLNAIIVMTEMLMNEIEAPEHKDNLEILNFSAKDLLSIVNDILDYSKIEAGKLELESIAIPTSDYLEKIVKTNYLKAKEKGIKLELDCDPNLPDILMGDPLRLGQVLKNLISNAVKFTDRGGVKLIVKQVSRDQESCRVYFGVKDTGIGIKPDKIESLFEVFTQASSETSRKYGGTGLGLAIVKSLLYMHNSRISVESQPDQGSLFFFEIDFPYQLKQKAQGATDLEKPENYSLKGYNILLVEDNAMNIMVAKKIFDKWDCKIKIAEDGYIAMQQATRHDFDLVLMDLQMPGIDGFETTRKIRKMSNHYKHIPIIALSAAAPGEVKEKVLEAGMNEMVTKPFNPKQLYALIKAYLPEPSAVSYSAPAPQQVKENLPGEDDINIQILVKLSTLLRKDKDVTQNSIRYMEDVAREKAMELEEKGLMEIVETINSIIRINRSYINNKNLLLRELMSDLRKSLDELKTKYQGKP
ncbi:MAG: PAS domain S-box protein [Bacteroidales bacterium]